MVESVVFCLPLASVDFVTTKSEICTYIQYVDIIFKIFAAGIGYPIFYTNHSSH